MSNSSPLIIEETNLSYAWSRAFLHIIDHSGRNFATIDNLNRFYQWYAQRRASYSRCS